MATTKIKIRWLHRSKPRKPRQEHDPSYKGFFSSVRMVEDLLKGFLTGGWLKTLDFNSLELAPSSYVGRRNRQRHNDIVWRLKSKHSGKWVYIYLMLEFQSNPYKFMVVRIMTYLGLFYETLIRQDKSLSQKDARLPSVIPIVMYNGKPRWGWPRKLSELLEPFPEGYEEYQPECSFLLMDEGSLEDRELAERVQNLVALLFRLENSQHDAELGEKIQLLNEELDRSDIPELEDVFDVWLDRVLKLRFPSINFGELRGREKRTMLSESIGEWIEKAETKGLEQGLEKGREEGREEGVKKGLKQGRLAMQELILGLLEQRFGDVPKALVSKIRRLRSQARLQRVAKQIVTARSLDELELA